MPHAPQLSSVRRFVSQPLAGLPSQSLKPAAHEATRHDPVAHVALPFATEQVVPHAPQLSTVRTLVSQPFVGFSSQSLNPALQDPTSHVPPLHAGVPFAVEQTRPHAPQLFTSLDGFAQ